MTDEQGKQVRRCPICGEAMPREDTRFVLSLHSGFSVPICRSCYEKRQKIMEEIQQRHLLEAMNDLP
jgi:predicted nucleic acid-binding Zn ribbon protein